MFTTARETVPGLDAVISDLIEKIEGTDENDENYAVLVDQLVKLAAIKDTSSAKRVSPDALVGAAANLAGILLILNFERVGIVTSKALGFVQKLK